MAAVQRCGVWAPRASLQTVSGPLFDADRVETLSECGDGLQFRAVNLFARLGRERLVLAEDVAAFVFVIGSSAHDAHGLILPPVT